TGSEGGAAPRPATGQTDSRGRVVPGPWRRRYPSAGSPAPPARPPARPGGRGGLAPASVARPPAASAPRRPLPPDAGVPISLRGGRAEMTSRPWAAHAAASPPCLPLPSGPALRPHRHLYPVSPLYRLHAPTRCQRASVPPRDSLPWPRAIPPLRACYLCREFGSACWRPAGRKPLTRRRLAPSRRSRTPRQAQKSRRGTQREPRGIPAPLPWGTGNGALVMEMHGRGPEGGRLGGGGLLAAADDVAGVDGAAVFAGAHLRFHRTWDLGSHGPDHELADAKVIGHLCNAQVASACRPGRCGSLPACRSSEIPKIVGPWLRRPSCGRHLITVMR